MGNKDSSLFEVGLSSVVGGILMITFGATTGGIGFCGLGGLSCLYHFLEKHNSKFDKLMKNIGIINKDERLPKLKEKQNTNFGYRLIFDLPHGINSDDFKRKQLSIEEFLNNKVNIKYINKCIYIDVYEKDLELHPYQFYKNNNLEIAIGHSMSGLEKINIKKAPHILIAGETGSGKSTLLRGIITNLILNKNTELHLIDLKNGAEFNVFRKSKYVKSFSRTIEESEKILNKLLIEVDERYDKFFENDCVDIEEYNKISKSKMKYKVLIIDEFADLQNEKDSIKILESLASKSRASGIHLIIATQRPDAKVLNGRIKANVPCVIGLKTMNEINSRIIIDRSGLEKLKGRGHGIYKDIEFQSMNLSVSKARDLIKHTYIKKKVEKLEEKSNGELPNDFNLGDLYDN
ncbi:FtsK/SpoIIIE domain-containing protein [Senegalia massiliensis]|uniref:DNA translocase FtsK n=1 Tax=Senegalia massiliensis TaxID=1720316 RepID=A0A845QUN7_9CLOT|nr:FtsK/SpoIIIE domain-containing protein [Senegalia massiliensis]NBI05750.1 DNA translocase FtsK [Senegalia massiliensis]